MTRAKGSPLLERLERAAPGGDSPSREVIEQLAAVITLDDAIYLEDLGSAGGVLYRGMRIGHKRIDEGDVFHICGHELSFTFRPG